MPDRLTTRLFTLAGLAICSLTSAAEDIEWMKPPDGAVVLFDGTSTDHWSRGKMTDDGCLLAGPVTKEKFADCILHLEFNMLPHPEGKRISGNSGVYIQMRYEIQILNSHGKKPYKGGCGAIYQTKAPSKNATRPLGEWQSYTIAFRQPRWDGDKKAENARIAVIHNGVKVHDNVEIPRKTGNGRKEGPEPGPIRLQHHGNKVVFRNIWLLPLKPDDDPAKRLDALLKDAAPAAK